MSDRFTDLPDEAPPLDRLADAGRRRWQPHGAAADTPTPDTRTPDTRTPDTRTPDTPTPGEQAPDKRANASPAPDQARWVPDQDADRAVAAR